MTYPIQLPREVEDVLTRVPDGQRVPVRYFPLSNPRRRELAVVSIQRRWFPARSCGPDDRRGQWPCRDLAAPPAPATLEPATARLEAEGPKALRKLAPSMVVVDFDIPYRLDGVHGDRFRGHGLVVEQR